MKLSIHLPSWDWIIRLFERNAPETIARANRFGKAKSQREWLHGTFAASVEIEKPKSIE